MFWQIINWLFAVACIVIAYIYTLWTLQSIVWKVYGSTLLTNGHGFRRDSKLIEAVAYYKASLCNFSKVGPKFVKSILSVDKFVDEILNDMKKLYAQLGVDYSFDELIEVINKTRKVEREKRSYQEYGKKKSDILIELSSRESDLIKNMPLPEGSVSITTKSIVLTSKKLLGKCILRGSQVGCVAIPFLAMIIWISDGNPLIWYDILVVFFCGILSGIIIGGLLGVLFGLLAICIRKLSH